MSHNFQHNRVGGNGVNIFMTHTSGYARMVKQWVKGSAKAFNRDEITWPTDERFAHLYHATHNIALAFGHVLRLMFHHISAFEHQRNLGTADREHIKVIRRHCSAVVNLAYRLMLFSGSIPIKPEPMDLNDVVRNIDSVISPILKSSANIEFDLSDENLSVMGDERLLKEVLASLISNANDATYRNGGTIAVATRRVKREYRIMDRDKRVFIGSCALLSVVDSGPGIETSIQNQIFEPFFTTRQSGEKMGLGLSITQSIVRAHRGCLNILSRKGEGTIVRIYLPLIPSHPEDGNTEAA